MAEEPDKKPFYVHCVDCGHEWAAAFSPMEVGLFAATMTSHSTHCPYCGGQDVCQGLPEYPTSGDGDAS